MLITKTSQLTGKEHSLDIPITDDQLKQVISRQRPIQMIVPELAPDLREFLISGITPQEWNEAFGRIDEE
jgi:hypothetical protein